MVTGAVLSVLLGLIILGGIKRIAAVTEKLVPMMAIIYVIGALSVIVMNYENIIPSFISIFADVFRFFCRWWFPRSEYCMHSIEA